MCAQLSYVRGVDISDQEVAEASRRFAELGPRKKVLHTELVESFVSTKLAVLVAGLGIKTPQLLLATIIFFPDNIALCTAQAPKLKYPDKQ
eukprot:scaffold130255_cov17-Tisochrysis_lutea.AAC.2